MFDVGRNGLGTLILTSVFETFPDSQDAPSLAAQIADVTDMSVDNATEFVEAFGSLMLERVIDEVREDGSVKPDASGVMAAPIDMPNLLCACFAWGVLVRARMDELNAKEGESDGA